MKKTAQTYYFCIPALALGALIWAFPGSAAAEESEAGAVSDSASPSLAAPPSLVILDPVDLGQGKAHAQAGEILRSALLKTGRFRPLPGPETESKLQEFGWNGGKPCHEFQCAFEAGNTLVADYVLFGTLTPLDGLFAYSFNVLDFRTGKVVASEAGHAPGSSGDAGEEMPRARLEAYAASLDPSGFDSSPKAGRGLIAVIDMTPESPESRVLTDRIGTHIHGFRTHDLMGQVELRELASAMEIPLDFHSASDSGLLALGARLNVAYLVQSRLNRENQAQRLDLALFDVAGRRKVRSWSSSAARDFRDILQFESRFFKTLAEEPEGKGKLAGASPGAGRDGSRWARGVLTLAGVAAVGGFGAMAYEQHLDANRAYRQAESSLSPQAGERWKRQTEEQDRRTVLFGSLAALALGATVTLWTF